MILQLTAKNCQISEKSHVYINKQAARIKRMLPDVDPDLIVLRVNLIKNIDRYHPPRVNHRTHKTYADIKTALANFEGSMTFRLNKNRFYTHFKGATIFECLDTGFHRLFIELEKYKDLHFHSL